MFGRVAHRYDLMNRLMTGFLDQYWRARTVRCVAPVMERPDARAVDLCCGTGDIAIALENRTGRPVAAMDFCHPMLVEANRKLGNRGLRSATAEADGLRLPLRDASVDLITIGFGFRNFANYRAGLEELRRVLKPGGLLAILELSTPPNRQVAVLANAFSHRVLANLGALLTGSKDAYEYLPESIRRFPGAEELAQEMRETGFKAVRFERLTFGLVALHVGEAP
jgi:demethylmenaquinone methyltransferase/2-methoxy-6-polyprenyl-1,4-benzoquinol methylase